MKLREETKIYHWPLSGSQKYPATWEYTSSASASSWKYIVFHDQTVLMLSP